MKYILFSICFFIVGVTSSGIAQDINISRENRVMQEIHHVNSEFRLVFGPLMGEPIIKKRPVMGLYSSLFQFSIHILINRESTQSKYIDGEATIKLSDEYEANGCFAVHSKDNNTQSKYITKNGKDYSYTRDEKLLMGVSGHWSYNEDDTISIQLTKSWRGSCSETNVNKHKDIQLDMDCVMVAKNDRLPSDVLVCKHHSNQYFLKKISINPKNSPRAGPFTFQELGQKRIKKKLELDMGDSWLLFGSEPGLKINSRQGIRSGSANVQFSLTPVIINEYNYRERQK